MPFNGSGTFNLQADGTPVVDHTTISSGMFNAVTAEVAAGLSTALCRDGQSTVSQNLPFNNKRITGLGYAVALTDAMNLDASVANVGKICSVGGTGDAITLTPFPAATAYTVGQEYWFVATAANTGATTVNVSGLGVKDFTKVGTVALSASDLVSGQLVGIQYDGTRFQVISPLYAEGVWTPSVGGTATYTTQVGRWTKIGRIMHIEGHIVINVLGTGSTATMSGLPIASANSGMDHPLVVSDFNTLATSVVWIGARVNVNATTITLRNLTAAGVSATSSALFGNAASVTFGGSYII
mgnify:CR=1 FL=1